MTSIMICKKRSTQKKKNLNWIVHVLTPQSCRALLLYLSLLIEDDNLSRLTQQSQFADMHFTPLLHRIN